MPIFYEGKDFNSTSNSIFSIKFFIILPYSIQMSCQISYSSNTHNAFLLLEVNLCIIVAFLFAFIIHDFRHNPIYIIIRSSSYNCIIQWLYSLWFLFKFRCNGINIFGFLDFLGNFRKKILNTLFFSSFFSSFFPLNPHASFFIVIIHAHVDDLLPVFREEI